MASWIPIESNPEVINDYCKKLGLISGVSFHDVYGLDDMLLDMVPGNCVSFILLFPITEKYEKFRLAEEEKLKAEAAETAEEKTAPKNLFFMKQTIGNACGTIGLIHAIANNQKYCKFSENSTLLNFIKGTEGKSSDDIASQLANDTSFASAHESAGVQGNEYKGEKVDLHFVAIVEHEGRMYELDGRKSQAICHGEFPENGDFKKEAAKICKVFMERDPEELRFTMLALSAEWMTKAQISLN